MTNVEPTGQDPCNGYRNTLGLGAERGGTLRERPPLSLALFVIDTQRYALDLAAVERVLPLVAVTPLPHAPAIALGLINIHGEIIPVVDIRRRFGFPPRGVGLTGHLLIARTARRAVALQVDEVLGTLEFEADAVRPAADVLPGIGHVAGIVALADGLLFIHDLDTFLSLEEDDQLTAAIEEARR